ncbi:cytochrome bd-type quinol oxidase, subunit II [Aurantimonas manganoxydans SI85-9A1]|uniref:Cytochrome bd-type quinol oxidase, subunit II n=1 Tax=Aurantimonas manganoxydans (strain ATCC BAA-1229 / DSM 21871 / SI85-9A1) TaxID=287752 RepID=Q1YGY5_AURMS|nr:cytochrome d ubiquinol oxidase subunit II [Aurantimonas manganoxydans]EAS49794.1 cytochrome bd-type quinol oxidase, subunit II [Aurantimonas manganoxydans SI85-9A1]
MDLAVLWAFIIAFAVIAYVILDGFDLGTGILFPLLGRHENRDTAMNTVAPIWDGNETWLVLGGGGLFAVFPLAYAIIMPAIYAPLIAMLLALIFRGVAFEFRFKTVRGRWMWDVSFFVGSIVAAFSQGIALGTLVQGIDIEGRAYAGGWFDWMTPFSLMTGVAVVVGYALLGATWLVMKTEGELHDIARRYAWISAIGTMVLIGVVSLWMPFMEDEFYLRWFTFPQIFYVAPVPILVALATFSLFQSLATGKEIRPFLSALAIFVLSFAGLGITFYPDIIPPHVTIWEAAAPDSSLMFLLVGASVLIPLILAYTAYSYWVFRGKVREGEGYHH